ncbi:MAG: crotonobetainyl-CoA hydratase [Parasphingorhabdus sp.]|jgi:crotonobetainyl-CoA hydratase
MSDQPFVTERKGHVLEVKLQKGKANAISNSDSLKLNHLWESYRDDEELRFAILTGNGEKFFSAGWDLKDVANSGEVGESYAGSGGFGGLNHPRNLYKPIVAAVNGIACGGGFEVMIGCDIIIAEEHATFALPEIRVGVVPDAAVIKLRRRIPYHVAVDFMMTGRWMDVEEAKHWGIVNYIVPKGESMKKARELVETMAGGPPLIYPAIKQVLRMTEMVPEHEAFAVHDACSGVEKVNNSDDVLEGARAFAEKRDPVWTGK